MNTGTPLHPSMGPAVLAHLSQFAELDTLKARHPGATEIFVAGQAVASALSELYGDGRCVAYNDVDAFVMDDNAVRTRQILTTLDFEQTRFGLEYGRLTTELISVYDVRRTYRHELLNEVVCRPSVDFARFPAQTARAFLESFDLNCVQVGVRLSDQALVWTPAFEDFLRTRQMLVMNVKTPVHTAIRWFKKKTELAGIYGHDEHAMELLVAMAQRVTARLGSTRYPHHTRMLQAQAQFGPQYAAKAEAVYSQLAPYFELRTVPQTSSGRAISLYTLAPRADADARLLDDTLVEDPLLPLYARALQGHWRKPVCERVLGLIGRPHEHLGRLSLSVHGMDTLASTRSNAHLDQMDAVYRKHPGLGAVLGQLNPGQQHAFLTALVPLAREKGTWVYGIFERLDSNERKALEESTPETMSAAISNVFEIQCAEMERRAREGANRTGELGQLAAVSHGGFRFELLSTFQALAEEGERMHHCVAGYFNRVAEGGTRIVALRKHRVEDSLTMEVCRTNGRWRLHQLRGLLNRFATDEEKRIALEYVAAMNLQAKLGVFGRKLSAVALLAAARRLTGFVPESVWTPKSLRYPWQRTRRHRFDRWVRAKATALLVGPDVGSYVVRDQGAWMSPLAVPWPALARAMMTSTSLRAATRLRLLSHEQAEWKMSQRLLDTRRVSALEPDLPF